MSSGENTPVEGTKLDAGKDPWHLMPFDAVGCVVKVLAFGANKYAARNWEKGFAWSRAYSALQRHLTAWWQGQDKDEETGFSHLWHVGCCAMFLIAFELRGIGKDDRPGSPE
jgi:hypothetical protein